MSFGWYKNYEDVFDCSDRMSLLIAWLHIAHCYIFKSFLGLRNSNAFTEAETGELPISCQNALECTKSHIKFQNFSGSNTPGPPFTGGSAPRPSGREGEEERVERKGRIRKGRQICVLLTFQTKVTPLGTWPPSAKLDFRRNRIWTVPHREPIIY